MQSFTDASAIRYVSRWFWRFDTLVESLGIPEDFVSTLIEAGCAPGPIYALVRPGEWWSALAASSGDAPPCPPAGSPCWYSPSSAWDLRRAQLSVRTGVEPLEAAVANERHFVASFVGALPHIEGAREAFASCWTENRFNSEIAEQAAEREWQSWRNGAYGVCLRVFNAQTCISKEGLAARIRRLLPTAMPGELLDDAQALAQLILPFAPWERPNCTPGQTIDRLLERANLGREIPYPE